MRILELCTSRGRGGLELYALKVSRHLESKGHVVHAAVRHGTFLDADMRKEGFPVIHMDMGFKPFPLKSARKLARYIDENKIDLIQAHWNNDLVLAALAKRLSNYHCKLTFIRHIRLARHKKDPYHRFIYNSIDKYIVITHAMREEAIKYLPIDSSRIELLYHGVEEACSSKASVSCESFSSEHGIAGDQIKVLLPGRVEYYKAQHVFIDAIFRLKEEGLTVQACIMGHVMHESYMDELKQKVREKGLENHVHFIGFIENSRQYYNCFDMVALTTYIETFGLVLVEAMLSGVPVIGARSGGVPEIIMNNETGLLFEPGDDEELARCIRELAESPEKRSALATKGREYAKNMFSMENHYRRLDEILGTLQISVESEDNA